MAKNQITLEKLYKQINTLTSDLIGCSLCIDQNYPSIKNEGNKQTSITVGNANTTMFLKNIPYLEAYKEMLQTRSYNMKFIDNGCVLMQYLFENRTLKKARLAYFPNPEVLDFQNHQEVYEDDELELYADILDRNIMCVPIRFDYDPENAIEIQHPKSHLTLGQYENCRIPVTAAITPFEFISFIVRNFYNTYYTHYESKITNFQEQFDSSILDSEKSLTYIHLPI